MHCSKEAKSRRFSTFTCLNNWSSPSLQLDEVNCLLYQARPCISINIPPFFSECFSKMFLVPEVQTEVNRQSLEYPGTLLPRNYEILISQFVKLRRKS